MNNPRQPPLIQFIKIKLDLAAGEHEAYGRGIWESIDEAKAAGKVVGVGTRVIVTFNTEIRNDIATLEVAKGEDALWTGAWEWM